jgi:hypothetical protein
MKSPGGSNEQIKAEKWLFDELSKELGVKLIKQKFDLEGERPIELDGFCEYPLILCEAWSYIGSPRGCQPFKVMSDAVKLMFVNNTLFKGKGKCILLFADHEAVAHFISGSWMAQCLKYYDIEVKIIEPPQEIQAEIRKPEGRPKCYIRLPKTRKL